MTEKTITEAIQAVPFVELTNREFAMSKTIGKLVEAHAKAKQEMGAGVKTDSQNSHFRNKYASLHAALEVASGPLAEQGLTIIQMPGHRKLGTLFLHKSGEWIWSTYALNPTKDDPQGWGSAITYARRYTLLAVVGLGPEDDDDGNAASTPRNGGNSGNRGGNSNPPKNDYRSGNQGSNGNPPNFNDLKAAASNITTHNELAAVKALVNQAAKARTVVGDKLGEVVRLVDEAESQLNQPVNA
jgi:hypothetical protein